LYKKKYETLEEYKEPENFEKIFLNTKKKDAHEAMEKHYYAILKKKYEGTKETPKEVLEEVKEPPKEPPNEPPKQVLHPIKKFKIDEETLKSIEQKVGTRDIKILTHLAEYLPKYFENNKEMQQYIQNKSFVSIRVKTKFLKDGREEIHEFLNFHEHDRENLAQSLNDLTEIMKNQVPIIVEEVANFIRAGSGYVFGGLKSVKLELTPYKIGVHKVHGYIPLYPWLRRRRGILNIKNKDDKCFWKCLYREFNPDPKWRNDFRDVPAKKLQEFMEENKFDESMFKEGFTIEKLAMFEEKYKISINIYDIGKNGLEETKQYYCSI
jgi:hypothetical protein